MYCSIILSSSGKPPCRRKTDFYRQLFSLRAPQLTSSLVTRSALEYIIFLSSIDTHPSLSPFMILVVEHPTISYSSRTYVRGPLAAFYSFSSSFFLLFSNCSCTVSTPPDLGIFPHFLPTQGQSCPCQHLIGLSCIPGIELDGRTGIPKPSSGRSGGTCCSTSEDPHGEAIIVPVFQKNQYPWSEPISRSDCQEMRLLYAPAITPSGPLLGSS